MSTIKANTLLHSDGSTTTQPSIPALDQRMAKAWCNLNGSGTVSINSSYNISSITDNGTGDYTANFSTAFSNANYALTIAGGQNATTNSGGDEVVASDGFATGSVRIRTYSWDNSGAVRATRDYNPLMFTCFAN
tara:strand:+ start:192 stop:593 length:402 start_codon:yes stop_codon:yes gene_type:complete